MHIKNVYPDAIKNMGIFSNVHSCCDFGFKPCFKRNPVSRREATGPVSKSDVLRQTMRKQGVFVNVCFVAVNETITAEFSNSAAIATITEITPIEMAAVGLRLRMMFDQ